MDIVRTLKDFSEKNKIELQMKSTISMKNSDMDVFVSGNSLEDAYNKLKAIFSVDSAEDKPQTKPQESFEDKFSNTFKETPKVNIPQSLDDVLKGKQVIRIASVGENLLPGESLQTVGNLTYVVKDIERK